MISSVQNVLDLAGDMCHDDHHRELDRRLWMARNDVDLEMPLASCCKSSITKSLNHSEAA